MSTTDTTSRTLGKPRQPGRGDVNLHDRAAGRRPAGQGVYARIRRPSLLPPDPGADPLADHAPATGRFSRSVYTTRAGSPARPLDLRSRTRFAGGDFSLTSVR